MIVSEDATLLLSIPQAPELSMRREIRGMLGHMLSQ